MQRGQGSALSHLDHRPVRHCRAVDRTTHRPATRWPASHDDCQWPSRAVLAFLMIRHLDSLLLFPEAFGALVLGKTYHVAKSAIVPGWFATNKT